MTTVIPRFKSRSTTRRIKARERREGHDPKYLAVIRRLPSCVSGAPPPSHPHHLRIAEERGIGLKATDKWAVPLAWSEHTGATDHVHTVVGGPAEIQWFSERGIDVLALAAKLYDAYRSGKGLGELRSIVEGRGKC